MSGRATQTPIFATLFTVRPKLPFLPTLQEKEAVTNVFCMAVQEQTNKKKCVPQQKTRGDHKCCQDSLSFSRDLLHINTHGTQCLMLIPYLMGQQEKVDPEQESIWKYL